MFNTGKLKKVNNLISAANSCVNNRDVKGARTALSQANDILKKIHGNKTQELLDWMTAAQKLTDLAKELHEEELTPEELQEEKELAAKAKVENAKDKAEIDSNPEYVKWMNYFWEHRIENDEEMQQKYVPLLMEHYEEKKKRDAGYEGARRIIEEEGTKRWWNDQGLGVLAFGIEPYTYFSFLCKNVIRLELGNTFGELRMHHIDNPGNSYFDDYIVYDEDRTSHYARPEEYHKFLEDIKDAKRYPICLNNKDVTTYAMKYAINKWQSFCQNDIRDNDVLNREKRLESLKIFTKQMRETSAFKKAVEYFNFIEKESE